MPEGRAPTFGDCGVPLGPLIINQPLFATTHRASVPGLLTLLNGGAAPKACLALAWGEHRDRVQNLSVLPMECPQPTSIDPPLTCLID